MKLADGSILAVGGYGAEKWEDGHLTPPFERSCEIYDVGKHSWRKTGSFAVDQGYFYAVVGLCDGRVLAIGRGEPPFRECELYDPVLGQWKVTGAMRDGHPGATTALLSNGEVLVTGGHRDKETLASCEIFSPAKEKWRPTASLPWSWSGHKMHLLTSGEVLLVGGWASDGKRHVAWKTCLLFDPAREEWRATGDVGVRRDHFQSVTLSDGNILVAGGQTTRLYGDVGETTFIDTCELYEAGTRRWRQIPPVAHHGTRFAVLLGKRFVLLQGTKKSTDGKRTNLPLWLVYDLVSRSWHEIPRPESVWQVSGMMPLGEDRVLVLGRRKIGEKGRFQPQYESFSVELRLVERR
ncbi:MAG: hypothetical protein KAI66_22220 [Lentisphaeria bacterium]|nr:hypothetical protein [Lentisphaeria bacterium]